MNDILRPPASAHRGPPLLLPAIAYTVLFVAGVVVPMMMAGGQHFPSPFDSAASVAAYLANHRESIRVGAFLQLGSVLPLAVFSATVASRLQFLGVRAAGVQIAQVGGTAAAALLAMTGALEWAIAQDVGGDSSIHLVHGLVFATGGPAHVACFGLLVAGVSVAAGIHRLLPRWLAIFGVASAIAAELSTLTLVSESLAALIPIGRFSGMLWMIIAGAVLPDRIDEPE